MISLSHNDLDGVVSQFSVRIKYGENNTYINTSYADISYYLNEIKTSKTNVSNQNQELIVTDLNFKSSDIDILISMSDDFDITYIDHHLYDENDLKKLYKSKITTVIDTSKSASLIAYEYFIKGNENALNHVDTDEFKYLVDCTNAYDIWLTDSELWDDGFKLNNAFWDLSLNSFASHVVSNSYMYTSYIKQRGNEIDNDARKYFLGEGSVPKVKENNGLLLFANRFVAYAQFLFPDFNYYMIVTSEKNISFRTKDLNDDSSLYFKDSICDYANSLDEVVSCGGHKQAFGVTLKSDLSDSDKQNVIQKLYNKFNEYQVKR